MPAGQELGLSMVRDGDDDNYGNEEQNDHNIVT